MVMLEIKTWTQTLSDHVMGWEETVKSNMQPEWENMQKGGSQGGIYRQLNGLLWNQLDKQFINNSSLF